MANSVIHPISFRCVLTMKLASQFKLNPLPTLVCARCRVEVCPPPSPSFDTCPSYSMPAGLVPKTNPFWRSWYVSKMTWNESVSTSGESLRLSVTTMPAGSESKQMAPT